MTAGSPPDADELSPSKAAFTPHQFITDRNTIRGVARNDMIDDDAMARL